MEKKSIEKMLFNRLQGVADDDYLKLLFDQYKIYINSAEKISDRRQKTNEFFLGLNTAIIAAIGFILGRNGSDMPIFFYVLISAGGIIICYLWYRIINSFKGINGGKFELIHCIENKLPLSLYNAEWEILGRGNDKRKYWPFSHIELNVPWIFIIFYSFIILNFLMPIFINPA
jgi:hypothetical protein